MCPHVNPKLPTPVPPIHSLPPFPRLLVLLGIQFAQLPAQLLGGAEGGAAHEHLASGRRITDGCTGLMSPGNMRQLPKP